jgi:hypothetical protein
VPHARLVSSPEDAEAYLTEARTVAKLDHPNIVPVYPTRCPEGSYVAVRSREAARLSFVGLAHVSPRPLPGAHSQRHVMVYALREGQGRSRQPEQPLGMLRSPCRRGVHRRTASVCWTTSPRTSGPCRGNSARTREHHRSCRRTSPAWCPACSCAKRHTQAELREPLAFSCAEPALQRIP